MSLPLRGAIRTLSLVLLTASLTACMSANRAGSAAREHFLAGQEEAFNMLARSGIAVVRLVGPFERPVVAWQEGLTLSELILQAGYLETREPAQILIQRDGAVLTVDPASLLDGRTVAVNPNDVVHVLP